MDFDLNDIIEIKEIRELISHKKNLLDFFNEIIKIKNIEVNANIINTDYELPNDTLYPSDTSSSESDDY